MVVEIISKILEVLLELTQLGAFSIKEGNFSRDLEILRRPLKKNLTFK